MQLHRQEAFEISPSQAVLFLPSLSYISRTIIHGMTLQCITSKMLTLTYLWAVDSLFSLFFLSQLICHSKFQQSTLLKAYISFFFPYKG